MKTEEPKPSVPGATEPSAETATAVKKGGGFMKWLGVGAGVLVVGGIAAAGLYYGKVIPGFQPQEELKGSAEETTPETAGSSMETETQTMQPEVTGETQELSGITQVALTTCPQGQVKDPVSNQCACDINNNYFQIRLQDASSLPVSGQTAISCTTCAALSDQIFKLGQSTNPMDISLKNELSALAETNNCSPCAVFDDRIASALQKKNWNEYFDLVVQKSNDQTCGRSLSTCDSLKWQLFYLNDLRAKAGKDTDTTAEELAKLKEKQQNIENELGTNTACYTLEALCSELKTAYEPKPLAATLTQEESAPAVETTAAGETAPTVETTPMVGTTPLVGAGDTSLPETSKETPTQEATTEKPAAEETQPSTATTQQQAVTEGQQISLQDGTSVDLGTISASKLFSNEFYLMHCPVGSSVTPSSTSTAPLTDTAQPTEAPKKVKRTQS